VTRRLVVVLVAEAIALLTLLVVGLDLYAHKQVEQLGGFNIWGYRGRVALQKQPNEIRLMLIGGTRAFSFGGPASGTTAALVRQFVMVATDRPGGELHPVVSLNLARMGALPDSYAPTIERYAYLKPDYICIYDDLGIGGAASPESQSGIFAATRYLPALPLVLREKGMLWQFGVVRFGYVSAEARNGPKPSRLRRAAGAALQAVGTAAAAVDGAFASKATSSRDKLAGDSNPSTYADTLLGAIDTALQHARGVVLVVSPAERAPQMANLAAVSRRIADRPNPRLRFVDLGDVPELREKTLRLDDWNYGGDATAAAARRITPAVVDLIAQR